MLRKYDRVRLTRRFYKTNDMPLLGTINKITTTTHTVYATVKWDKIPVPLTYNIERLEPA